VAYLVIKQGREIKESVGLPLQRRLPEGELRIAAGGTAPGTPRNKTDIHSVT